MTAAQILTLDDLGTPGRRKGRGFGETHQARPQGAAGLRDRRRDPGDLPEDLETHLLRLGGGPVAVRSSALGEDSAEASFAGQYETVLDVVGIEPLREAIDVCLASLHNHRASAYRRQNAPVNDESAMSVVVQNMVPAAAAGVLFTADPVTGRRDRVIVDAVRGLGEALVSGHASPTMSSWTAAGTPGKPESPERQRFWVTLHCAAWWPRRWRPKPPRGARWTWNGRSTAPATSIGCRRGPSQTCRPTPTNSTPRSPIRRTSSPAATSARCSPGACTPLSYSFTARSIDVGMQMMHVQIGIQQSVLPQMRFVIMNSGHLFLNLSTMSETATHAIGSSAQQLALSVCGRPVTEFTISGAPPPPRRRRAANGIRYIRYLLGQPRARRQMRRLVAELHIPEAPTAAAAWRKSTAGSRPFFDAMNYHLISSAGSGVLTPTLLGVIAGAATRPRPTTRPPPPCWPGPPVWRAPTSSPVPNASRPRSPPTPTTRRPSSRPGLRRRWPGSVHRPRGGTRGVRAVSAHPRPPRHQGTGTASTGVAGGPAAGDPIAAGVAASGRTGGGPPRHGHPDQ